MFHGISSIGSESPTASNTYQSSAEKIREMERRLDEAQSLHEDMNRSHTDSCLKRKIEAKSQDLLIATLEVRIIKPNACHIYIYNVTNYISLVITRKDPGIILKSFKIQRKNPKNHLKRINHNITLFQ